MELNKNPVDELVSYTSYKGIADSYEIQGNYYQALVCNLNALKTAKILKNKVKIEYCLHCLGNVYFDLGNISKAMDYWFMALKLSEETNNKLEYANLLALIGKSYKNLDDYDHALDYILKSIHISRELQLKSILVTDFVNIIDVYLGKGDTTTAIQYCFKSIELSNEMQTINFLNIPYNSLGKIYEVRSNQKNKDSADFYRRKAFNYYMESLKNAEKMGQKDNLIASYTFMGSFYLNENKNKQSENYLNNALKLSIESGEISFRKDIYELLSTLYGRKQDCEKERDYYKKFIALRDSLYNINNAKKMIRSEINFEFERKHEKEQLEQERKNIIIEEERKRQRTIFWAVTIVAIIVSIACLYILKGYHQKKKLNKELQLRNQRIVVAHTIIEEKNREITDSINYALHIQQATLPDKSQIYRVLPQSFILFKPKDIVSGDFYFFSIAYDKIYLAAADCTGHGVPGGFMSMIGSEKLNRAIKVSSETGSRNFRLTLQL
ncbi:MAG TPA: hypothetical protein VLB84_13505 [Bacteroidia bacterium]|nr:hypothetical protein [Bacteroidia bacterium]